MDMGLGGKACSALDVGDGGFTGDKVVRHGKVWTFVEGSLIVQGRKESTWAKEEANPPEGGVGETMVLEEEFFL